MSGECRRFEVEALLKLEQGEALDAHFGECPDCVRAGAAYRALQGSLARAPRAVAPPQWEARTWAEIRRREDRPPSRFRLWPLAAPLAAASIALAIVVFLPGRAAPPGLFVSVEPHRGQVLRGTSAQPGDRLQLRADLGRSRHAELRVYRDGALAWRCAQTPACAVVEGRLSADLPLEAVGRYQPVLLLSDQPLELPEAQGERLEQDREAAVRSGATVFSAPSVDVY